MYILSVLMPGRLKLLLKNGELDAHAHVPAHQTPLARFMVAVIQLALNFC